jgi:hypothetical protein
MASESAALTAKERASAAIIYDIDPWPTSPEGH